MIIYSLDVLFSQFGTNLQCKRLWFNSWVRETPWRRDRVPTPVFLGFPCGSAGKESAYNAGGLGSIPGLGSSPGERKGYPLQYSCLENPHGQRSLAAYRPWGRKELDMTEQLSTRIHCSGDTADTGLIPGSGRSPGGGNGGQFQYSCLKIPMDRGAWQAPVCGVTKSRTQPSD